MGAFEVAMSPQKLESRPIDRPRSEILGTPATSKVTRSAPKRQKLKFDPPLDALGSGFYSALRINIVRHTYDRMAHFL